MSQDPQLGAESAPQPDSRRSVDSSLAHGVAWAGLTRLTAQMAAWAVTILVARILAPSDYGIVASATVYIALMRMITEFGLGTAIVSQRDLTSRQIAQLGGLALMVGCLAFTATLLLAKPVAAFLRVPQLSLVIPVLGASTVLATLNALPTAILQRDLRFKVQSSLEMLRAIVSSVTLLIFSLSGFGFWSLILNEVCAGVTFTAALYFKTRYQLAWPRMGEIRDSLRLSSQVMASRLAWYVYDNADVTVVSRRLGSAVLGDYSMGWMLTSLPSQKLGSIITSVTPAVFARVQHNKVELARYFLLLVEALAIVLLPATIGLSLVASELVSVVLGNKWSGAVPIIQVLGVLVSIRSITPLCSQVLIARLRARLVMQYTFAMAAVLPIGFVIGSHWGALGVALAWLILFPPLAGFQFWLTCREIEVPIRRLFYAVVRPTAGVAIMASAVLAMRALVGDSLGDANRLMLLVATGVLTYGGYAFVTLRSRFFATMHLLRSRGS